MKIHNIEINENEEGDKQQEINSNKTKGNLQFKYKIHPSSIQGLLITIVIFSQVYIWGPHSYLQISRMQPHCTFFKMIGRRTS